MSNASKIVLRLGLAGVILWFGMSQLADPQMWAAWVPGWAAMFAPAQTLVVFNGIVEMVLGVLLALGLFTRLAALLLALHVLSIAVAVGYNDIGVRDVGLAIALFSVFLSGIDSWCLERKISARNAVVRALLMGKQIV